MVEVLDKGEKMLYLKKLCPDYENFLTQKGRINNFSLVKGNKVALHITERKHQIIIRIKPGTRMIIDTL